MLFAPKRSCRIGPSLKGMDTMHEWRNPLELRLPGSLIAAAGEMVRPFAMDLPPMASRLDTNGHDYGTARMNLPYCLIDWVPRGRGLIVALERFPIRLTIS